MTNEKAKWASRPLPVQDALLSLEDTNGITEQLYVPFFQLLPRPPPPPWLISAKKALHQKGLHVAPRSPKQFLRTVVG